MKKIRIKSIAMHYFKGIENRTVDLGEGTTLISAPNGAGKSTIADAFHWCLWGKNARGEQKFSVKTLDRNGVEIPHVNHEVEVVLGVGDETDPLYEEQQTFKRVLVPEYDNDDQLKGNHTDYFWNDVPMKKSEYDAKVSGLVKETVFKLIATPYAFLELDWQKQRDTLMRMAGDIRDEDVPGEYEALVAILKIKSLEEYQKEISAKLKKVNEAMVGIPARIDEVKRGMPETPDLAALNEERCAIEAHIADIDKEARDDAAAINARNADRNALAKQISDLEFRQQTILNEAQAKERNDIHMANSKYTEAERMCKAIVDEERADNANTKAQHTFVSSRLENIRKTRTDIEDTLVELRNEWQHGNSEQFSAEEYLKCPLYGHNCMDGSACAKYDQNQEEAYNKFMAAKKDRLQAINDSGKALKQEIEVHKKSIEECEAQIVKLNQDYEARCKDRETRMIAAEKQMKDNPKRPLVSTIKGTDIPEWVELGLQIELLKDKLSGMTEYQAVNSDNSEARRRLVSRLDEIKAKQGTVARIDEGKRRIDELEKELSGLGLQKAELEFEKQKCRDFEVDKMNMITDKINHRFTIVRWQMFQRQVNGEEVPACVCLCGGVPWTDANDAGKLNAGIDVAHTLAKASSADVPMFIDGAEKSTNIYNPGGQRILLKVEDCREMTITIKD